MIVRRPKKDCNSISRYICIVLVSQNFQKRIILTAIHLFLITSSIVSLSCGLVFNMPLMRSFASLETWKKVNNYLCPKKKFVKLLYTISRNFYLSPFRIGKFISSWPNSLFHSRRNGQTVVTVKWRETTQPEKINIWIWILKFEIFTGNLKYDLQNVHNDAKWPNITRFVESFWT